MTHGLPCAVRDTRPLLWIPDPADSSLILRWMERVNLPLAVGAPLQVSFVSYTNVGIAAMAPCCSVRDVPSPVASLFRHGYDCGQRSSFVERGLKVFTQQHNFSLSRSDWSVQYPPVPIEPVGAGFVHTCCTFHSSSYKNEWWP